MKSVADLLCRGTYRLNSQLGHSADQISILAGHLPKQNCHVTWYGFGTGNMCLACGTTIGHEDVEMECE